ncbi:hypothetical protein [Spirosoma endbachense]|uniref:Uncharacterized protein n=1 Tax=Spirosoma endbachense TaxID=2666025 RepID=A0A6P1W2B2_9BACT|nr:hypothetical protein [Spirosoma endbachense]QHV98120.1 hypothetical protein GJR95_25310 [Spirosoma endbachense]
MFSVGKQTDYFALSETAVAAESTTVAAESVAIVVVSVDKVAVESVVDSSVLGLLWQAAKVSMLPTNSKANIFFIALWWYFKVCGGKYTFFLNSANVTLLFYNKELCV